MGTYPVYVRYYYFVADFVVVSATNAIFCIIPRPIRPGYDAYNFSTNLVIESYTEGFALCIHVFATCSPIVNECSDLFAIQIVVFITMTVIGEC